MDLPTIWIATAEYYNDSNGDQDVIAPFSSLDEFEKNFATIKKEGYDKDPEFNCYFVCEYTIDSMALNFNPRYRRYNKKGKKLTKRSTI